MGILALRFRPSDHRLLQIRGIDRPGCRGVSADRGLGVPLPVPLGGVHRHPQRLGLEQDAFLHQRGRVVAQHGAGSAVYLRVRVRHRRRRLGHMDLTGSGLRPLCISTETPEQIVRRFFIFRAVETEICPACFSNRIAGSLAEHLFRDHQPADGSHGIHLRRAYRASLPSLFSSLRFSTACGPLRNAGARWNRRRRRTRTSAGAEGFFWPRTTNSTGKLRVLFWSSTASFWTGRKTGRSAWRSSRLPNRAGTTLCSWMCACR